MKKSSLNSWILNPYHSYCLSVVWISCPGCHMLDWHQYSSLHLIPVHGLVSWSSWDLQRNNKIIEIHINVLLLTAIQSLWVASEEVICRLNMGHSEDRSPDGSLHYCSSSAWCTNVEWNSLSLPPVSNKNVDINVLSTAICASEEKSNDPILLPRKKTLRNSKCYIGIHRPKQLVELALTCLQV